MTTKTMRILSLRLRLINRLKKVTKKINKCRSTKKLKTLMKTPRRYQSKKNKMKIICYKMLKTKSKSMQKSFMMMKKKNIRLMTKMLKMPNLLKKSKRKLTLWTIRMKTSRWTSMLTKKTKTRMSISKVSLRMRTNKSLKKLMSLK